MSGVIWHQDKVLPFPLRQTLETASTRQLDLLIYTSTQAASINSISPMTQALPAIRHPRNALEKRRLSPPRLTPWNPTTASNPAHAKPKIRASISLRLCAFAS
jgi:hypothetical protein